MRKTSTLILIAALAAAVAVPTFSQTAAAAPRHGMAAPARGLTDDASGGLYDDAAGGRIYAPYDYGANTGGGGLYDSAGGELYDSAGSGLSDDASGAIANDAGGISNDAGGGLYDSAGVGGGGLLDFFPNRRALPFDNSPPATGGGSYGYNVDNLLNR